MWKYVISKYNDVYRDLLKRLWGSEIMDDPLDNRRDQSFSNKMHGVEEVEGEAMAKRKTSQQ